MLPRHWSPTLWQSSFVDAFIHPSQVVWISTLAEFSQCCDNVQATLWECCTNIAFWPNFQHCRVNIGWCWPTLRWCLKQCCMDVMPRLCFNENPNVATMLCWDNIQAMLWQCCFNSYIQIWIFYTFPTSTTISILKRSQLQTFMPTTAVELMIRWCIFEKFPQ